MQHEKLCARVDVKSVDAPNNEPSIVWALKISEHFEQIIIEITRYIKVCCEVWKVGTKILVEKIQRRLFTDFFAVLEVPSTAEMSG